MSPLFEIGQPVRGTRALAFSLIDVMVVIETTHHANYAGFQRLHDKSGLTFNRRSYQSSYSILELFIIGFLSREIK